MLVLRRFSGDPKGEPEISGAHTLRNVNVYERKTRKKDDEKVHKRGSHFCGGAL